MNKKNKYLIEKWNYDKSIANNYNKFIIEGVAEMIFWKRILRTKEKLGTITKYQITKIE